MQAVGGAEDVGVGAGVAGACIGYGRVAGQHEVLPLELQSASIGPGFAQAADVAEGVGCARAGGVCAGAAMAAPLGVVGQGDEDLAGVRVHRHPFRAVQRGGARMVGRQAGFHHHLGLAGKAGTFIQSALAMHQRQPVAAPVGIEPRGIQGAVVQQVAIGGCAAGLHGAGADEFVEVFEAGVVAHVHRHPAVGGQAAGGAFLALAAQGGALDGGGMRIERVDLHHPAEAVGFVRVA